MKIWSSPYQLRPLNFLNAVSTGLAQEGTLLKIQWPDGLIGYSDLHPWPTLGDARLEDQVNDLKRGRISAQAEQSIWLARKDAKLRAEKKNIFDGAVAVKNNYIATHLDDVRPGFFDELKKQGFTHIKIKMGRDLAKEKDFMVHAAAADFRLRLDFNGVGSWPIFERFMSSLSRSVVPFIEYVEDPFPYDEAAWRDAQRLVKIAIDGQVDKVKWNFEKAPFDVVVLKPAKTDVDLVLDRCQKFGLNVTVTSYMDHPVGMMHALGIAMEAKKLYPDMSLISGCFTHQLFSMDQFSSHISTQGPYVLKVPGTGVGFDSLLEAQKWQPIKIS